MKKISIVRPSRVPKELRQEFEDARLATNINRMWAFSIYIIVLQIALNIINMLKPSDGSGSNIMIYVFLSLGTLMLGIVYCILYTLARKGKIRSRKVKVFLVESLLYLYTLIQLTFCTLNIISDGGVNSYIIAILIIGLVPIIHPTQSILTILTAFAYVMLAMFMTRHVSGMWNSILITDVWANLIIISGLTACISVFVYQMYVSNFLQSVDLRQINTGLEETVRQRTAELEKQTQAAEVASKSKSEFLARMSHELRTPLNAVMGMTQIARKAETEEKLQASLNEIDTASSHLLDILNDVLDMSKIEFGKFDISQDPFNLRKTLEESASAISLMCREKAINFVTHFDVKPNVRIIGDKIRLKQVISNLLSNAVKFTPEGGEIRFTQSNDSETDEALTMTVTVKDSGIGMTPEQVSKLFVAFEQAGSHIAARYGGTGLGLAISQHIVKKTGGQIQVQSEAGKGSTFFFTLTMEKVPADEIQLDIAQDAIPDLSGKRILLVEDIEINRVIVEELLKETGITVDSAEDGQQAVDAFTRSPEGYYDLVFMDIQMPVMNGYQATEGIRTLARKDAKAVPIIAMTANAYREDVEQSFQSGMNGHLAKPIDVDTVMHTLLMYLNPAKSA